MMETLRTECDHFSHTVKRAVTDVRRGIHHTSWHHILLAIFGAVLSIFGMGGQVISLNLWLNSFPDSYNGYPVGGPFTVLAVASTYISLCFLVVTLFHIWRYRPKMSALANPYIHLHGLLGSGMFALNGIGVVLATSNVSEVIQALLTATQLIFTLFFTLVFKLNKGKNYCHVLVILGIGLSCAGIALGSLATTSATSSSNSTGNATGNATANSSSATPTTEYPDEGWWATIFALGILPGAATVVVSASLVQNCTYDEDKDDEFWEEDGEGPNGDGAANDTDPMLTQNLASETTSIGTGGGGTRRDGGDSTAAGSENVNQSTSQHNKNDSVTARAVISVGTDSDKKKQQAARNNYNSSSTKRSAAQASDTSIKDVAVATPREPSVFDKYEKMEVGFARMVFLVESGFFQIFFLAMMYPLDFAPWIGPHAGNTTASTHSLKYGIQCVFNSLPDAAVCKNNALYYVIFASCFAANNAGNVIVSAISAPLASMVGQLAAPVTAVILVIAPSLSAKQDIVNLGMAIGASFLIAIGVALFSFWEQMTSVEQREAEHHQHPNYAEASSYGTIET